jgi:hypothetical protein
LRVEQLARPISLLQPAVNETATGFPSSKCCGVAGTKVSTSEQAAQVHNQARSKARRKQDASKSQHTRCIHDKRQTRYVRQVRCSGLLLTWSAGVRFVTVAAYVPTAGKRDGVRCVKLSWDVRITPTHGSYVISM